MINRTKMPRQLRNKGGITSVISRKKYGIGSDIKDFVRDIIPNELADVAVKVAPIVAPFYPGYAAIARGLGRFDQRGSISDALKQGAATYGFGKVAGKLGGAEGSEMGNVFGRQKYSMEGFKERGLGRLFKGGEKKLSDADKLKRAKSIENTPEFMKTATEATIGKVPLLDKLPPMVQQKLLVGGVTAGASALYSYFTGEFEPQEPGETMGEYMARRNQRVKEQMRGYMDSYYTPLRNPQYAAMSDEEKNNFIDSIVGEQNDAMMATGGRVGYQVGGISSANTLAENIARNRANQAAFNQMIRPAQLRALKITPIETRPIETRPIETRPIETRDLNLNRNPALDLLNQPQQPQFLNRKVKEQTGPRPGELDPLGLPVTSTIVGPSGMQSLAELDAIRNRILAAQAAMKPTYEERLMGESWETLSDNDQYRIAMEYPGETPPRRNPDFVPSLAKGGMPTGIMRSNKAGVMERDYRDEGGFVPVGIKEKADDVPAMLSKNEFVFTADAVRGAGNGSIEKGAQKMYDTMKNLERRVV